MLNLVLTFVAVRPEPPEVSEAISTAEALSISITMEGLLFAAFAVGNKLTEPSGEGRSPFYTQGWFGWCIVAAIGFIAVGAGATWWEQFGHDWPPSVSRFLLGIGLAIGIVSQPIFAAAINRESKKI